MILPSSAVLSHKMARELSPNVRPHDLPFQV
jgi:hypothetical protein